MAKTKRLFKATGNRFVPPSVRMVMLNRDFAARAMAVQPDVVHCHDLNTLVAGVLVKRCLKTPLVYDSHELFVERNIGAKSRRRDKALWGTIERLCIGRCDVVVSVAQSICDHLQRKYSIEPPCLVRNVQPFESPRPRSSLLRDELGIDPGRAVVVYPGAITINRGLEQLIDSAPMLDRAAYVIMGHANNAAYLASLLERARRLGQLNRTVFFRRAVPMEQVIQYLASADAGIVPTQNACLSYYFESSNKIFHCIMAGVPLAMSDHPEKRAIVLDHGVGVLFDETTPSAIAQAVNNLLSDGDLVATMRANCLKAARTLNWQHEQHRLRGIYARLLGHKARPVPEVVIPHDSIVEGKPLATLSAVT